MKTTKTILQLLDILVVDYKSMASTLAYKVSAKIDYLLGYELPADIEEKIRVIQSRLLNGHCCPKDACEAMDEFLELDIDVYAGNYEEKKDGVVHIEGVGYKRCRKRKVGSQKDKPA